MPIHVFQAFNSSVIWLDQEAQEGKFVANSQLKKAEKTLTFVIRFGWRCSSSLSAQFYFGTNFQGKISIHSFISAKNFELNRKLLDRRVHQLLCVLSLCDWHVDGNFERNPNKQISFSSCSVESRWAPESEVRGKQNIKSEMEVAPCVKLYCR